MNSPSVRGTASVISGQQGSQSGSNGLKAPSNGTELGYDAFLKLLVAQMQNQDPMEPMQSSDYVAQLSTFSQVGKTIELNDRVEALLSSSLLEQAGGVIGRHVTSADGIVEGTVAAARIVGNDVVAVLTDGREIKLDAGVIISGGAA